MKKHNISLRDWCEINNNEVLLKEWDFEDNSSIGLYIEKIAPRSNKKVFWKCLEKGHIWNDTPDKRTARGYGCPVCTGRRLIKGVNDLLTIDPELLIDWDYERNANISPADVTRNSHKRIFWKCHTCGHKWDIEVFSRTLKGSGCPKCALKIRGENKHKTSLETNGYFKDDELLKDWDYKKNYPNMPKDFTPLSNKSVYWKCHKCGYTWMAKISNRVRGRGCPLCANKAVVKGVNDLATTHPAIAKEWHPTKNGSLTPEMITYGYGKKVYWLCSKGHTYSATVNHRTGVNGTKCPICNIGRQSSFAEQALYFYVKKEFPDAINRYKPIFLEKMELDIYIPSYRTAIEYDGAPWHKKNRLANEQKKYKLCHEQGIKLIRVREEMSDLGSEIADWEFGGNLRLYEHKNLNEVIAEVIQHLTLKLRAQIDVNVDRDELKILKYINEIDGVNFETEFPMIAKEWHPTKNGELKPNMFKPHSEHMVWWICPTCGNEYASKISQRSYGSGCPICGSIKAHRKKRIPVEMIDPNTNEILRTFDYIEEASKIMKINSSNISMVCKGNTKRTKAGGYKWRYKNK